MKRRTLVGIALPILTIVVFFVLLAFSLVRLSAVERDMRIDASPNMLWVVSRAHAASLRLGNTVGRVALDDADAAQLQRSYNNLLSRLALLHDGPQRRRMQALGYADELAELRTRLPELGQQIASMQSGDMQTARAINTLLVPYTRMLGRASNKAMVAEWNNLGEQLDTSRAALQQITISLLGILLAGAVLTLHFLLAIRDAGRRTRLLDKEKAFSELLIGSSGEGIVAVDMERRCSVWNGAAQRLFHQPAETTIGRTLGQVSGFFEIDRIEQAVGHALAGRPATLDDQPFFADVEAAPRYLDLRCFPLRDDERIIGAILLVFDVTKRRADQREIAMHRDHLEQLVHARTQELDAALERERAAAEMYRNFGAMISHQFRTPLAIVDSTLQRLIRRGDQLSAAELRERGDKARQGIARMVALIESTLDAARLDAGQIASRSQPCDLAQLAAGICAQQREATTDRQINLELSESLASIVHCDPAHVEHILTNLVSNAVKYSAADTPVTVTVRASEQHAECAVTNSGTLDCPAERGAVFERYYRGKNAEGHSGIGIGLYMARGLARMQGGDVQLADGAPGTVTFMLRLPLMATGADPAVSGIGAPA